MIALIHKSFAMLVLGIGRSESASNGMTSFRWSRRTREIVAVAWAPSQ